MDGAKGDGGPAGPKVRGQSNDIYHNVRLSLSVLENSSVSSDHRERVVPLDPAVTPVLW